MIPAMMMLGMLMITLLLLPMMAMTALDNYLRRVVGLFGVLRLVVVVLVPGDATDADSLVRAFEGVSVVISALGGWAPLGPAHDNVYAACKACGVGRVVPAQFGIDVLSFEVRWVCVHVCGACMCACMHVCMCACVRCVHVCGACVHVCGASLCAVFACVHACLCACVPVRRKRSWMATCG